MDVCAVIYAVEICYTCVPCVEYFTFLVAACGVSSESHRQSEVSEAT